MRVNRQARGWARYLYSDDQPRDDDGKWTDGSGSSVSSKSPGPVREIQYRGGVEGHTARVQYSTRNQKMAESYVDMSNDRFGSGAALHRVQVQIQRPAPASEIETIAKSVGIDNEFNTPASVFDSELHGRESVDRLVNELERRGYDGAILPDIAYGTEIEDDAFISFQKPKVTAPASPVKTPVTKTPTARTFPKIEERRRHERIRARAIANREQRLKERRERMRRERLRSKGKFLEARNLYSDDQPRDDDGKWTDGGGGGSRSVRRAVGETEDPWDTYSNAVYPREVTDKELRQIQLGLKASGRLNSDGTVSVYHTTLSEPKDILREGLIPGKVDAAGQDWKADHSSYATYFHLDVETALRDAELGGSVIEARLPVTKEFMRRIIPDEDSASIPEWGRRIIARGGGAIAVIGGVPASRLRIRKE